MACKIIAAALLACAAGAHAADFETDKYVVTVDFRVVGDDVSGQLGVANDSLVWNQPISGYVIQWGSVVYGDFSGTFGFSAKPGYRITGFTVDYSVHLSTDPYVVTGTEDSAFRYQGLPVGSIVAGGGTFTSNGETFLFDLDNPGGVVRQTFETLTTLVGIVYPRPLGLFCTGAPESMCGNEVNPFAAMTLDSLSISPIVQAEMLGAVIAVPEPESYALLLAGLAMLGATARSRRYPATRRPAA